MAEQEQAGQQGQEFKDRVRFDNASQTLEQSANALVKFGGFDLQCTRR